MFKVNHLGKVKSSFMLDPDILTESKSQAAKVHLTLGNVVEQALQEYLQRVRQHQQQQKEQGD